MHLFRNRICLCVIAICLAAIPLGCASEAVSIVSDAESVSAAGVGESVASVDESLSAANNNDSVASVFEAAEPSSPIVEDAQNTADVWLDFGSVPKNESEMKDDLQNDPNFYYSHDVTITDLQVIKRQTNIDDKTDYVWVDVLAENESIACNLMYKLDYTLYNEGWLLDLVTPYENALWDIRPLTGPVPETALIHLSGYNECTYISEELDLENKCCTIYFSTTTHYAYATQEAEVAVPFYFDASFAGWNCGVPYTVSESITWDLAGYWYPIYAEGIDYWRDYHLEILDEDTHDNSIYVVVFDDRRGNILFEDYVTLSSAGCEIVFDSDDKIAFTMERVFSGTLSLLEKGLLDSSNDYIRQ